MTRFVTKAMPIGYIDNKCHIKRLNCSRACLIGFSDFISCHLVSGQTHTHTSARMHTHTRIYFNVVPLGVNVAMYCTVQLISNLMLACTNLRVNGVFSRSPLSRLMCLIPLLASAPSRACARKQTRDNQSSSRVYSRVHASMRVDWMFILVSFCV